MLPDAAGTAPDGSERFYVWEIPGAEAVIHLRLDVVDRINAALRENLSATSERRPEIGGILLGSIEAGDRPAVVIEDFQVLGCEYATGASWTLSANDRQKLGEHIHRRSWPAPLEPVGCFRSHTRPGLYLDQDDLEIFSQFFSDPKQVFLLVRPAPDAVNAGFFVWDKGGVHLESTSLAFPFDAALLNSGAHPVVARRPAARSLAPPPSPAGAIAAPVPLLPGGWGLPATAAAVLLMAAGFYQWMAPRLHLASGKQPAPQTLALSVERAGSGLRLVWDRESAAVREANAGTVNISERRNSLRIDLNPQQLASGSMMYFPHSPDVTFDMELRGPTVNVNESVRALIPAVGLSPAAPISGEPALGRRKLAPSEPSPVRAKPRGSAPRTARRIAKRGAPAAARAAAPAAPRTPAPRRRHVTVTCEPAVPSRFARIIGRIPLVRALHGNNGGKHFVPAAPLHEIKPVVPSGLSPETLEETVQLKVHIDETGRVTHTKPLSNAALASQIAADSDEWRFRPARVKGKSVASEVLLRFTFEL